MMKIYRTGTIFIAPRVLYDEPSLDLCLPKIFWNWISTPGEEMATKSFPRTKFSVLITAVVDNRLSRYLN
jgi:hypothetical protein